MKTAHDLVVAAKANIAEVTVEESAGAIQAADYLIDVREPDEYRSGHIEGAIGIPRGLLEFKLSADPGMENRDLAIVLYCKTGGRSALAAHALVQMGYHKVVSMAGGVDAWTALGKPLVTPQLPAFD